MEKSKKSLWQVLICIGLLCVVWGVYVVCMRVVNRKIELVEDDFSWIFQVESTKITDEELVLDGFAFRLDQKADDEKFKVVLKDLATEEFHYLEMNYLEREDVKEYFSDEIDYSRSGFEASIDVVELDLTEKSYEVLLRMGKEKKTYSMKTYIVDGKLVYENSLKVEPLDVEGTDLQKVVEDGILRVCRPEDAIYVYQYEGNLFWIAEKDYAFGEDGDVYVQYRVETTQQNKLPEERLENKLYWDDCGFMFGEQELVDWNTGKYRVARKELPTEYPVKMVCTGRYKGEWKWVENFRPYYSFER